MKKHNRYIRFCMKERPNVIQQFPDMKPTDVTRELARRWKRLSEKEKENQNIEKNERNEKNNTQNLECIIFLSLYLLVFYVIYLFLYFYPSAKDLPLALPNPYTGINDNVYPLSLPKPTPLYPLFPLQLHPFHPLNLPISLHLFFCLIYSYLFFIL